MSPKSICPHAVIILITSCLLLLVIVMYFVASAPLDLTMVSTIPSEVNHSSEERSIMKQETIRNCQQNDRRRRYTMFCKAQPPGDSHHLGRVIFDYRRQSIGCMIGKTGTRAWKKYILDIHKPTTGKNINCSPSAFVYQDKCLLGYKMSFNKSVTTEVIADQYSSFMKYLIIRHPLQRLVSGYFQGMKLNMLQIEKHTSFTQFVRWLVSDEEFAANHHWKKYTNACGLCNIDYDLIMKSETMDDDIIEYNKMMNVSSTMKMDKMHTNRAVKLTGNSSDDTYKYDGILYEFQQKHPVLMRKLLDFYNFDMKLFGYTWDWENGQSSCITNNQENNTCC